MTRIMVVEDNPYILKLSRDLLASRGYDVITTSSPEEVVPRVEAERPQLVLMDVQLPGASGLDLARQLKASPETRGTVILAFTALAMKEDEENALAAGCDGYISKPIDISRFLEVVSGFLPALPARARVRTLARSSSNGVVARIPAAVAPGPAGPFRRPDGRDPDPYPERACQGRDPAPPHRARQGGDLTAPLRPPEAARQEGDRAVGTVLVIDDNPAVVRLLEAILGADGYETVTARNGSLGLAELRRKTPDVVITDVSMPGLTGYDVCRAIKGNPDTRLIPVVMVTAYGDSEKKIQGIECGADDFIDKPFIQAELLARVRSLMRTKFLNDQLETAYNVIMAMARVVEAKDQFTWGHTDRVSRMAVNLGEAAGLRREEATALHYGGVLHDIGKIEIPDGILNKPGPLDDAEWLLMKHHPVAGAEIVRPLKSLSHVLPLVLQHHERLDGSGYPCGLAGEDISVPVRILSIVDVYDALTNQRSYKPPFPRAKAVGILEQEARNGRLDPELVELFIQQRLEEV